MGGRSPTLKLQAPHASQPVHASSHHEARDLGRGSSKARLEQLGSSPAACAGAAAACCSQSGARPAALHPRALPCVCVALNPKPLPPGPCGVSVQGGGAHWIAKARHWAMNRASSCSDTISAATLGRLMLIRPHMTMQHTIRPTCARAAVLRPQHQELCTPQCWRPRMPARRASADLWRLAQPQLLTRMLLAGSSRHLTTKPGVQPLLRCSPARGAP